MGDFDGMVALVTGGASGIGAATAALLADRGARTAVLDLDPEAGDPRHLRLACDVTDRAAVERAVERVADDLGRLDVVVNNAGIGAQGDVAANDDDEWHRVLDVNVVGMARVTRPPYRTCGARRRRRWSTPARWWPPSASPAGPCTRPARGPCSP